MIGGEASFGAHARVGPTRELICKLVADHPTAEGAQLFAREQWAAITNMSVGTSINLATNVLPLTGAFLFLLGKDSVRSRMETEHGISFTEFAYQLLQANDFYHLHTRHGCELQIGGSDQWGNIVAGLDLIRRRTMGSSQADEADDAPAFGLTLPLLSFGGSGLVANIVAVAILLRVDYENRQLMLGRAA